MPGPIVYLVDSPAPYRNAEMDRAASELGTDAVQVVFLRGAADGCFQYRLPEVCPARVVGAPADRGGLRAEEVTDFLAGLAPHLVIVGGYLQPVLADTLRWCRRARQPYCLRSDSNLWTDQNKGFFRYLVRRLRLGRWVGPAHAALLTGTYNRGFWDRYGLRPEQAGWWPQWIDYDHFASAQGLRANQRPALREQFGITSELALLYVGRLIARKRVDLLCEALLTADPRVSLVVAGHGPQEELIRSRYVPRLGSRLVLLGDVQPADLPRLYAATDALVLASGRTEPWGMVLNEATIAGLPILCDRQVGAAGDLLRDGQNGLALAGNELADWQQAVARFANASPTERQRWSTGSVTLATAWRDGSDPGRCLGKLLAEPAVYRG